MTNILNLLLVPVPYCREEGVTGAGVSAETNFSLVAEIGAEPSEGVQTERPWPTIIAAIAVIVVVVATAYFILKKR